MTKDEAADMVRVKQDVELFLRLARLRTFTEADMPINEKSCRSVIAWLAMLVDRYAQGEDISKP